MGSLPEKNQENNDVKPELLEMKWSNEADITSDEKKSRSRHTKEMSVKEDAAEKEWESKSCD